MLVLKSPKRLNDLQLSRQLLKSWKAHTKARSKSIMKVDPIASKEHDEIVNVVSAKGDKATYKINKITKQVFMKTALGDGNDQEWRHCNTSYDSIANLLANPPQPAAPPVTATAQSYEPETTVPVGVPGFETPNLATEE